MDIGRLLPFGARFLLGGGRHVHCLAGRDEILRCGSRFLTTNSGIKTKKRRSSARSLSLRLGGHSCFSSWKETLFTLGGGISSIFTSPEMHSSAFLRHNTCLVGTFLASGAPAVIRGTLPQNAPPWLQA